MLNKESSEEVVKKIEVALTNKPNYLLLVND